jgi:hypothetical protein
MRGKKLRNRLVAIILLTLISASMFSFFRITMAQSTVVVPSNPLWTDTGLDVNIGQDVTITASGSWTWGYYPSFGPDGDAPWSDSSAMDNFLYQANHGELIAYVGSDPTQGHMGDRSFFPQTTGYWAIGSSGQFTSDKSGKLWLGFNDDAVTGAVGDNSGTVTALITTTPSPPTTHTVFFEESGVGNPAQVWSVTFDGYGTEYSNGPGNTIYTIVFDGVADGGPYQFTVTPPSDFVAHPTSGPVTVSGGDVHQPITFSSTPVAYTFTLAAGSGGSVSYLFSLGSGTVLSGQSQQLTVPQSCQFSLTASPDSLYVFQTWSTTGPISVSGPSSASTTATVNGNGGVKADFAYDLGVSIIPTSASIQIGESVAFTATASGGSDGDTYVWYWMQYGTTPPNDGSQSTGTSNMYTFTPSSAGDYGVYVIVTDSGGNTAQSLASSLMVTAPPADFELTVPPSTTTASPQEISSFTVTVTSLNGFNSPVMLTAVVDSAELTATFSSPTVTPPADGSTQSTMKVSVLSTQLKTHTILVYGISGAVSHFVSVNLKVPFLSVPYYSQGDAGWCVPTSVAMIAEYYGISVHPWDVANWLGQGHTGRSPSALPFLSAPLVLNYLSGIGLSGTEKDVNFDEIKAMLDANMPMVIACAAPLGHAFVITGYLDFGAYSLLSVNDPSGYLSDYFHYTWSAPYVQRYILWSDLVGAIWPTSWIIGVSGNGHSPVPSRGTLSLVGGGDAFSQRAATTISFKHPDSLSGGRYIVSDVYIWQSGFVSNPLSLDTSGLTWRSSSGQGGQHLWVLDSEDVLSEPLSSYLIVNPTDDSQTYYFEMTFSKDGLQKWTSGRLASSVEQCFHADYPLTSGLAIKNMLSEYGQYIIKLFLYTSGGALIDEVELPPISYVPLVQVVLFSPANVLLTDPQGRKVGFDPNAGQVVNGIPDAVYSGPGTEPQLVMIPDIINGTYSVLLVGTASGNYTLILEYITNTQTATQTVNGTIGFGQTQKFKMVVAATGLTLYLPGDINIDGKVDMKDIGLAARAFGETPTRPRWNPMADENEDGKIDLRDIAIVAKNFGKTYS